MSCNTSIDYKTYLFHKEKIINFVYEENNQVVFREKFNQMLQKIKNQESRKWIKEKIFEILGNKSVVYDKMSIIEALNSIENNCYGKITRDSTSKYEVQDGGEENNNEGDDEGDDEGHDQENDDEGDDGEDDEVEGFLENILKKVEGFGNKNKKKKKKKKKRKKKKRQANEFNSLFKSWKNQCYTHEGGGKINIKAVTTDGSSCSQIEGKLMESNLHKEKLCSHCQLKSSYFLSGNEYNDESRNISGTVR